MNLRIIREPSAHGCTLGALYLDGRWQCWTLEDEVRDVKVAGQTAIPFGKYPVVRSWSPAFQRQLPHVMDVPNFTGIRIHAGNTAQDTEGCILVGQERGDSSIYSSRSALEKLLAKWVEPATLTIVPSDGALNLTPYKAT